MAANLYSVFGNAAPPYAVNVYTDATAPITLANVFYLTNTNGSAISWHCAGGRVYIPNDPAVTGKSITIMVWVGDTLNPLDITYPPAQSITTTTPVGCGWCEVMWNQPFVMDYGPSYAWVAIGFRFNDPATQQTYLANPYGTGMPDAAIPSLTSAGSTLVLASVESTYIEWHNRGNFVQQGDSSSTGTKIWYGIDIIVDDGTDAPEAPIGSYGFNEGTGTTAYDASGSGHDLAVLNPAGYTTGHYQAGLVQTAANTFAINASIPWLSTPTNPNLTLMFWGKRLSEGTLGNSMTVYQTVYTGSEIAWGLMMSDGTNGVASLFIQGFHVILNQPKQPLGEWHHYTLVTNGYYIRTYIDGVMTNERGANGSVGGTSSTNDQNLIVFSGDMQTQTIDDLRIFNVALSPAHIAYYMGQDITLNNRDGKVKVWNGTAWVGHSLKTWNGTSWAAHPALAETNYNLFVRSKGN